MFKTSLGQGPDMVILPGWATDHRFMSPISDVLKKNYRLTIFDLPGCGKSSWSSHIKTIDDMADLLLPFLPKTAICVGWSIGGLIAISLASRYPERISKLIGLATTPKFVESPGWPAMPKPGFKGFSSSHDVKFFLKKAYDNEFANWKEKPKRYHQVIEFINTFDMNFDVFLQGIDLLNKSDLRPQFQSIHCPIHMIIGYQDSATPLESSKKMQDLNSHVQVHAIPQAGHCALWTHPEDVNTALTQALA